jgi:hypothetical protein
VNEHDLSAGWQPIGEGLADTRVANQRPEPAADTRIQRLQAKAAEKRTDRHDAIQTWTEKRQARRNDRAGARAERRQERDERRTDRAAALHRAEAHAQGILQRIIIVGPILAPMAVAWTGQSRFATQILGWPFAASILYAAAYELTTVYNAWLYHQARSDGDSGWEYRLGTWIFAIGAAVQQWWHYSNHWHSTPRSVTYSIMSIVGVLLWEGRARLIHRRKLRVEKKLAPARPRIGLARWIRYPVRSWTAWSLITLEGHRTLDDAWTAADAFLRSKKELRADRAAARRSGREARRTERLNRTGKRDADRTGPEQLASGPDHPALTAGPDHKDRTALPQADRTITDHQPTTDRTAGPDQNSKTTSGPDRLDRTTPVQQQSTSTDPGPQAAARADHDKPEPTNDGPDQAEADLVLTEVEQQAIELLQSTKRSISKRNIADAVRNELGRSIGSDRAAEIARHFRTLRSAA